MLFQCKSNFSFSHLALAQKIPEIIEHPRSNTIRDGSSFGLKCRAIGSPRPSITWYKNNQVLDPKDVAGSAILSDGDIDFISVSAGNTRNNNDDSGNYWCRAQNQFGFVDSNNATLTVAWLASKFQRSPNSYYFVESGKRALLHCSPPKGNPDPEVYWLFNGNPIQQQQFSHPSSNSRSSSNSQKINIDDTGNLIIYNVNTFNSGEYQCVASQKDVPENPGEHSTMAKLEVLGK